VSGSDVPTPTTEDFERFTPDARHVVVNADRIARDHRAGSVNTGALLLAAVRRDADLRDLVTTAGLHLLDIDAGVRVLSAVDDDVVDYTSMRLSDCVKRAMVSAIGYADSLTQVEVRPANLMMGLLDEPDSVACTVLAAIGGDRRRLRAEVYALLGTDDEEVADGPS
jgi:ATP-dependent Clp protease ATP-binding subunit ClpA